MKYKSILHLTVAAVLMVLSAACEKFSPEPPELLLTLDGKPYQLREENSLRGLPGEEITFGITVKGNDRKQVSFTVTRDGFMNAQASFDQQTRTGTFTIMVADLNDSYGSVKLNFKADDMTVSYVFNIQSETFSYDTPESVTCNSGPGDETEISFQFSTTVDNPQMEAVLKDGTSFELVSLDYSRSDDAGIWDASVVVRNKKENKTGYDNTDCLVIQHAVKRTYTRAEIRLSQPPEDPPHVDGCVYIRNWPLKRALNEIADTDGDGEISFAEADAVKRLDLQGKNLNTTEGLDVFHNLEWLDVSYNPNLKNIILDDPGSFSRLKYVKAIFDDNVKRYINASGCYCSFSLKIETDPKNTVDLLNPKLYYSNPDVKAKGEELIVEHTRGNGTLALVFCLSVLDVDYESGSVHEYALKCSERLFQTEPITQFRDYFDIYIDVRFRFSTKSECDDNGNYKWDLPDEYDSRIMPQYYYKPHSLVINVVGIYGAGLDGIHYNPSSTMFTYDLHGRDDYATEMQINMGNARFHTTEDEQHAFVHECGHAIAGLDDQYRFYKGMSEYSFNKFYSQQERNISFTDDPELVPWKRFFGIEKYNGRVGIYRHEGNGIYYPSDPQTSQNYMATENYNDNTYFDSVGRWCFFRNLSMFAHTVSEPEEAWPLFLEYDVINDNLPD